MTSNDPRLYKDFLVDISPEKIAPAVGVLDQQIEALDSRIAKIVENFTIANMPLMGYLLQTATSPEELKKFSKGLERAADLITAKNAIEPRRSALHALSESPQWFIGELNDFSEDVDSLVESILSED